MKGEQLEIMRVIEFPKNRIMEERLKDKKLEVAYNLLDLVKDYDYSIVLSKKAGAEIFELPTDKITQYVILTTNKEKARNLKLENACIYQIEGNEFD